MSAARRGGGSIVVAGGGVADENTNENNRGVICVRPGKHLHHPAADGAGIKDLLYFRG